MRQRYGRIQILALFLVIPTVLVAGPDPCADWSLYKYRIGMSREAALAVRSAELQPGGTYVAQKGKGVIFELQFDEQDRLRRVEAKFSGKTGNNEFESTLAELKFLIGSTADNKGRTVVRIRGKHEQKPTDATLVDFQSKYCDTSISGASFIFDSAKQLVLERLTDKAPRK